MSNHPGLQDYEASELGGSSEEGSIGDASSRPLRPDELETHLDMHAHWLEDAGREDDPPNNLEGSRLPPNADLRNRNLRGANLAGIVFGDALVSGTDFRDADLQDADMSGVQGLTPRQLAGAMLSRIDLPENVTVSEGCSQATQTARLARTIFLMIIGACIFCLFAIATTSDQDLLAGRADHSLPFVDVTVPVRPFMVYAPLFLLVVYGYFHLYLQAL